MRTVPALAVAGCAICVTAAAAACGGRGPQPGGDVRAAAAGEGATPDTVAGVEAWAVKDGAYGMRATARWVLSPDRRALLAVVDGVSIEGDPFPDGFLYASERTGAVVQLDDTWDVAPSPDWTRLAFGRAFVLRGGDRDSMPDEEWRRLEARLPEDVARPRTAQLRRELKAHAFPVSGMSLVLGLGLTQVVWVDGLGPGRAPAPVGPTHSLYGWRVRWTPSGDTLGAGTTPQTTYDAAAPARWVLVRPRRWASYRDSIGVTTDSNRFARVRWTTGPTMELGADVVYPPGRSRAVPIEGGTIEARDGEIRVARDSSGRTQARVVGPGIPLAATARGRFILALVARRDAKPHETRAQLVVYHVPPR